MKSISRRNFIKSSVQGGLSAILLLKQSPAIFANNRQKVRVLGTHVTLQETIRLQAMKDLNIDIEFSPGGSAEIIHQASTRPESFDIYEQWSNSIRVLWQAGAIQGIEVERLKYWNEINNLTKKGKIAPEAQYGLGDAPYKILYEQKNHKLGSAPSSKISFMPYVHNTDSFGYNSKVISKGIPYETESWSWLLDPKYAGKVAIVNEPTIGLFDLALAAQAKGLIKFKDMGSMTRDELNSLFSIIRKYRQNGHFRGVWSSVPHSVKLMQSNEVIIQSMFSPGVSALNGMGIPCIYAAPKEGYRAWHGVMCLSSKTKGYAKEASYKFMNWWLSGWAGAFIARQGYYIANPERSKDLMSKEEWDYWYMGQPAMKDLLGTDGKVSVKKGEVRTGGSYIKRFSNIAVWNTVMSNYEYSLPLWNEFVLGG